MRNAPGPESKYGAGLYVGVPRVLGGGLFMIVYWLVCDGRWWRTELRGKVYMADRVTEIK